MANTTIQLYTADVYESDVFTGVYTDTIDHLDLTTKRIHLRSGVTQYHPVDNIYRDIRYIRANDESLRVMDMPVEATGNIPKGGGKFTPRLAIFKYGWRIVPANESHVLKVTGEQITDDGQSGAQVMDMTLFDDGVNVSIEYAPPDSEIIKQVEYVNVVTGTVPTASETANAVWGHSFASKLLTVAKFLGLK